MDYLRHRLEALDDEVRTVQRRRWRQRQLAGSVLVLALVSLLQPRSLAARAPGGDPERTLWQLVNLWGRVGTLERTLTHGTSAAGAGGRPEVRITGANLRLVNGLRATATANGLGNLLVGYHEPRQEGHVETGSHNVVVGQGHKFSRFGGRVVGRQNESRGACAAGSGGFDHTASANATAGSGGTGNTASGESARSAAGIGTRPAALPPPSAAGVTTRLAGTSTGSPAPSSPTSRRLATVALRAGGAAR